MILRIDGSQALLRCDGCGLVFVRGRGAALAQGRHFHVEACYRGHVARTSRLSPERRAYLRAYWRRREAARKAAAS